MDDHVRRLLQQNLVVRDVEHGPGEGVHEVRQPFQGLDVQVVGGLVQQQDIAPAQQQPGHLDLHPLPAGQGVHGPGLLEEGGGQAQPLRRLADLPGGQGVEPTGPLHIGADGQRLLLGEQLLGEIPHLAVHDPLAPDLGIAFHQVGVVDPFEQGGLAVALLADEGRPLALVQGEGKVVDQQPVVLSRYYGHVSNLQHICLPFPRSEKHVRQNRKSLRS